MSGLKRSGTGELMDIRRVQITGGSSFVVTLPKEWTTAQKVKKNDPVRMITQADGTLLITANLSEDLISRVRTMDVSSCTSATFLFRSLIGIYIAGYSEITICSNSRLPPFVRGVVRNFTQMTIGQEVMEENDTTIRIRDLLNPSELSFQKTLKCMYVISRSMHEDAIGAVQSQDSALLSNVIAEDRDVDRLQWLVARQTNMVLRNTILLRRAGLSPVAIVSHAIVARIIERIADHAVRIATNGTTFLDHPLHPELAARLQAASAFSLEVFDRAIGSFFSHDMKIANQSIEDVQRAEALCEELHALALSFPTKPAVALGYIAESIRRLGEYSGDIAEIVINDAVEKES